MVISMNNVNISDDLDTFKEDVNRYYAFLLTMNIDVICDDVSFGFLISMFPFSRIAIDKNYAKAICYYLVHLAKKQHQAVYIDELKHDDNV